jgi:hypothetical protein
LTGTDMPAVRTVVREASRDNYRFSSLILGIVRSVPFRMRIAAPAAEGREASPRTIAGLRFTTDSVVLPRFAGRASSMAHDRLSH